MSGVCPGRLADKAEAKPFAEHHLNLRPQLHLLTTLQQHSVQQTCASLLPKSFFPLWAAILFFKHLLSLQMAYNAGGNTQLLRTPRPLAI